MFTSWMATDLYCCRYLRLAGKNCTTRVLIMFKDYLYSLHYDKANPTAEHLKMSEENPKSRVYLLNGPPTCRSTYFRLTQANGKKVHNSGCWSHQKAPHSLLLRQGKFHGWTFEREWRGPQAPRSPPEWPLTCGPWWVCTWWCAPTASAGTWTARDVCPTLQHTMLLPFTVQHTALNWHTKSKWMEQSTWVHILQTICNRH